MGISVLISVYKSEKPEFLEQALCSVWDNQFLKPDEVILIKDGPLGNNLDLIISAWKNKLGNKLQIVINQENLGLTKSLNKGLKVAKFDLIARMDSDDISAPVRFRRQKEYLDAHPDIAIVGGSLQEFDSENKNLGIRHYPKTNDEVFRYIYKASPLAHPAVMMRKNIFEKGISYNENYRTSQDIALWFDVLKAGYKIGNIDDVIVYFRRDGDVFKRRSRSKAKNELKIYIKGIRSLYGLMTWKYIYPLVRYCFRMMPEFLIRNIYNSKARKRILQ